MKRAVILMLVVALAGLLAQSVSAVVIVAPTDNINLGGSVPGNTGGPFLATVYADDGSGGNATTKGVYWSFCCQNTGETFNPGTTYDVTTVKTYTEKAPPAYYLTAYAAWVFTRFSAIADTTPTAALLRSAFDGLAFTGNQGLTEIQNAIWSGMVKFDAAGTTYVSGTVGPDVNVATSLSMQSGFNYNNSILTSLGLSHNQFLGDKSWNVTGIWDSSLATADLNYIGAVKVLNLTQTINGTVYDKQDQLGFDDLPKTSEVPEPASVLVWSLLGGALGLVGVRRRRA